MSVALKITAAVAMLVAAGWYAYAQFATGADVPDDPKSLTYYKCAVCGKVQELTDRQVEAQRRLTAEVQAGESAEDGSHRHTGKAMSRSFVLICPGCNKVTSYPANKCPHDGEIFVDRAADGSYNVCPKCGWSRKGIKPVSDD